MSENVDIEVPAGSTMTAANVEVCCGPCSKQFTSQSRAQRGQRTATVGGGVGGGRGCTPGVTAASTLSEQSFCWPGQTHLRQVQRAWLARLLQRCPGLDRAVSLQEALWPRSLLSARLALLLRLLMEQEQAPWIRSRAAASACCPVGRSLVARDYGRRTQYQSCCKEQGTHVARLTRCMCCDMISTPAGISDCKIHRSCL